MKTNEIKHKFCKGITKSNIDSKEDYRTTNIEHIDQLR